MINEKGFMFLTMMVALAVLSLIALGAAVTTAQILKQSHLNRDYATIVRQAQNVGFSVSQDMVMARMVSNVDNATTPDVEFVTIIWKDWESGFKHDIRYIWSNPADSLKKVIRKCTTYDENGLEINSTNILLADNIYSANLTRPNDTWRLTVEAWSGDKSVIREYEANQRVE
jgi:hypothetical protein